MGTGISIELGVFSLLQEHSLKINGNKTEKLNLLLNLPGAALILAVTILRGHLFVGFLNYDAAQQQINQTNKGEG